MCCSVAENKMLSTIARVMFPSVMPFVNMIMESEKGSDGKKGESPVFQFLGCLLLVGAFCIKVICIR